ncbi:MAG: hypothetical protein Q7S61_04425 [bacterium]|nr:hypothetical protein [bacterium]
MGERQMYSDIIIAGSCAAESREQVLEVGTELQKLGVEIVRASLWKPRTRPGWDGVHEEGIPWLAELTKMGLIAATEVLLPEHVSQVINGIEQYDGDPRKLLLWLGSRNQNHFIQKEIGKRLSDSPPEIRLLMKNQTAYSEDHWKGIIEHVESGGLPRERMILCNRGVAIPPDPANPYRNKPFHEVGMRVSRWAGIPMVLDLSHIAGSVPMVFKTFEEGLLYPYAGIMVEVHPDAKNARTDPKQQLSLEEFASIMQVLGGDKKNIRTV